MSSCGGIELCLFSLGSLLETLEEMRREEKLIEAIQEARGVPVVLEKDDGTVEEVDILVRDVSGRRMGFRKNRQGEFVPVYASEAPEVRSVQQKLYHRVRQKYVRRVITAELARKGYRIVEEKDVGKDTIRLVARRWS